MMRLRPLLALLLLAAPLPLALADDPPVLTIVGNVTYENGTFTFTNPVVVSAGATLTFRNATVFLDHQCAGKQTACPDNIHVQGGGKLRVERSVVDAHGFSVTGWQGYHVTGLNAVMHASDSTFRHYNIIQLWDAPVERLVFLNNTFDDGWGPIHFRTTEVDFLGNLVQGARNGALQVDGADVTVHGNRFTDNAPWWAVSVNDLEAVAADVAFTSNLVEGSKAGVRWLSRSGGTLADNLLRDNGDTLVLYLDAPGPGVALPVVRHNTFRENENATIFYELPRGPLVAPATASVTVRENAWLDNCIDLWVYDGGVTPLSASVDATQSWWGSASGPQSATGCPAVRIDDPGSAVATSPWLLAAPAWLRA